MSVHTTSPFFVSCLRACHRSSVWVRISYVLQQIGFEEADKISRIVNTLAHTNVYNYESDLLVPDSLALFVEIYEKLNTQYAFVIHSS